MATYSFYCVWQIFVNQISLLQFSDTQLRTLFPCGSLSITLSQSKPTVPQPSVPVAHLCQEHCLFSISCIALLCSCFRHTLVVFLQLHLARLFCKRAKYTQSAAVVLPRPPARGPSKKRWQSGKPPNWDTAKSHPKRSLEKKKRLRKRSVPSFPYNQSCVRSQGEVCESVNGLA